MASPQPDPHDAAFFQQMRACRDPYRRLADCFDLVVGKQATAIDIGCGIGLQTGRLKELGWEISGAEYSPVAIEMREPGVVILPIDLTAPEGASKLGVYDCVICTETAEHIPQEHAMAIVRNVAGRAKNFIIWSAAAPGQEWEGHINLQPPEYWLSRFRMLGWDLDEDRTAKLRYLMSKHNAQHVLGKETSACSCPRGDRST
jgi:SAM-dependent methyltransferase